MRRIRTEQCTNCGRLLRGHELPLDERGWCERCRYDDGPSHRRRMRMYQNGGLYTLEQWEELKRRTGYRCVCCGASDRKLYRDHIKPVAKGGRDSIRNIQPLCRHCNFYKAARHSMSYIGSQAVLCFCPEPKP